MAFPGAWDGRSIVGQALGTMADLLGFMGMRLRQGKPLPVRYFSSTGNWALCHSCQPPLRA